MIPFVRVSLAVIVVAAALTGCAATPEAVSESEPTAEAVSIPADPVAPPTSITWEASCVLTTDEVATVMAGYGWQPAASPEPVSSGGGSTECGYPENTASSTRQVAVDFHFYDSTARYGWLSPNFETAGFVAADAASGAADACAVATSAPGSAGVEGVCTTLSGVPAVIGSSRTSAAVFTPGDYFFLITLYGISGGANEESTLSDLATLVATRTIAQESATVPPVGQGPNSDDDAVQGQCPSEVTDGVGYGGKPYAEVDLSVLETALAVDLPNGPACVVLNDGDTSGSAGAFLFYTDEDETFANAIGNNLVASGYHALGDPIEYRSGGSTVDVYTVEAGDSMQYSTSFEGSPPLVFVFADIVDPGYFS